MADDAWFESDRSRAGDLLDPLDAWPSSPPPGYLGQLEPQFQDRLAEKHAGLRVEDCDWYHSQVLNDGTVIVGQWDLRGREHLHTGGVHLAGKSVLEIGPASGYLTYWMESQGARVTSFEAGYDATFDRVPPADGSDFTADHAAFMRHIGRLNDSWWFAHRMHHSSARIVYGDLYSLPEDLGSYDVAFIGCVLLHLADPFRALREVATHVNETIVVTDLRHPGLEDPGDPLLRFNNDPSPAASNRWWDLSPGAVTRMLWRLHFERTGITFHSQRFERPERGEGAADEVPYFTVVATRVAGTPRDASIDPQMTLRSVGADLPGARAVAESGATTMEVSSLEAALIRAKRGALRRLRELRTTIGRRAR